MQLEAVSFRGPVMVVLGILFFAVDDPGLRCSACRPVPMLGLIGAGPLAMFIRGFASPEVRWRELADPGLALTAACMILFGDLLNLPIPHVSAMDVATSIRRASATTAGCGPPPASCCVLAVVVYFVVPRSQGAAKRSTS